MCPHDKLAPPGATAPVYKPRYSGDNEDRACGSEVAFETDFSLQGNADDFKAFIRLYWCKSQEPKFWQWNWLEKENKSTSCMGIVKCFEDDSFNWINTFNNK